MKSFPRVMFLIPGLLLVAIALLAACSGEGSVRQELTIEIFDLGAGNGLSGSYGAEIIVAPGFEAEPVFVVEESDIESWDADSLMRFSDGERALDLADLVRERSGPPGGLVFKGAGPAPPEGRRSPGSFHAWMTGAGSLVGAALGLLMLIWGVLRGW